MEKSLRKLRPANCSRTRQYLGCDELQPRNQLVNSSYSPKRLSLKPSTRLSKVVTPREPFRTSKLLPSKLPPDAEDSIHPALLHPWELPITSLTGTTSPLPLDQSIRESRSQSRPIHTRLPLSPKSLPHEPRPRKALTPGSSENCSRINELISYCSRPNTASENKLRRRSPKLSISFQDLKECLVATMNQSQKRVGGEEVAKTLRTIKRKRREEARNVADKATIRTFLTQRREVSNYIITRFRRMKVWRHVGPIVPKRLEESLHQYWTDLKS